jgi:hypothetical protein
MYREATPGMDPRIQYKHCNRHLLEPSQQKAKRTLTTALPARKRHRTDAARRNQSSR